MTVSFIIPVYNCSAYLEKCVDSIRKAGIEEYEILLIDDGSTDGSGAFCDVLARKYAQIRVVHQDNAGVSEARNRGIVEARGEYILFVDSDDVLLPFDNGVLECLNRQVDMVMFGMIFRYYHKDRLVKDEILTSEEENEYSPVSVAESFARLFMRNYLSPVWNKFFRRSVLIEHNLRFDRRLTNYEDLVFSLCVIGKCKAIVALPGTFYVYRVDYDHDRTVDRIAHIQDVMGNTDLIAEAFVQYERAAAEAGAKDTKQVWECLRNVYFELFYVKMQTTALSRIPAYCKDFQRNVHVQRCLKKVGFSSDDQQRWYRWICRENAVRIWSYVRYRHIRHFAARNLKRMTGWRL